MEFFKAVNTGEFGMPQNKTKARFQLEDKFSDEFTVKTLIYLSRYDSRQKATLQGHAVRRFMNGNIESDKLFSIMS